MVIRCRQRAVALLKDTVIVVLLVGLALSAVAYAEPRKQELARNYATLVGRLALTESLFERMSEHCHLALNFTSQQDSSIDYHLRMHTGMTFQQWQQQFGDPEQANAMVADVLNNTLRDIGECEQNGVQQWFSGMQQNLVGPAIEALTALPTIMGLHARGVSEQEALAHFRSKVLAYKTLSAAEIIGLAKALNTGGYHYAQLVFLPTIGINHEKAVELFEFAYQQEPSADNLYALAQGKAHTDRKASVIMYKQAAEAGLFEAQRWYGNYQGCQGNKPDALFWLQKAKETNPEQADFIEDFIVEINELGEPTNCLDGWVY
ncbi:hypothetical protein [Alteromonas sp. AMM-1]|uniref:hypothetical protein n=1 Tax=Alteromonas sp. AMM-1 TaxID=3394233 RepID=UPI0039A446CB